MIDSLLQHETAKSSNSVSAREAHHKTYPDSMKQEDVCYGVAMAQYDTFYVVGGDSEVADQHRFFGT